MTARILAALALVAALAPIARAQPVAGVIQNRQGGGARFEASGRAPHLPKGAFLHVSLTVHEVTPPLEAAFIRVVVGEEHDWKGLQEWQDRPFGPDRYVVTVRLVMDGQAPNVRQVLERELGLRNDQVVDIGASLVEVGTRDEHVAHRRDTLIALRDDVDGVETLREKLWLEMARMRNGGAPYAEVVAVPRDAVREALNDLTRLKNARVVYRDADLFERLHRLIREVMQVDRAHERGDANAAATMGSPLKDQLAALRAEIVRRLAALPPLPPPAPQAPQAPAAPQAPQAGGQPGGQPGAQTHDITPRYALGDQCEVEGRMDLVLRIRLQAPSARIDRTSEQQQVVFRRHQDRVTEVKDGKVATVERRFLEAWEGLRLPGARELEREPSPLHQRRIQVGLDADGKRRVQPAPGEVGLPEEALRDELHTERWEAVLPAEPVAIGATWRVEGDALRRAMGSGLGEKPEGKIDCRFAEVREVALDEGGPRERYAVIAVQVEAAGKQGDEEDAPRFAATIQGELLVSLARKKVAKVDLRGEGRLRQTRRDGEVVVEVDGRGPLVIAKRIWFPARPQPREGQPTLPR